MRKHLAIATLPLVLSLAACGGGSKSVSGADLRKMAGNVGLDCSQYAKQEYTLDGGLTSAAVCGASPDDPRPGLQLFTYDGDSGKAARGWASSLHADVLQRDNWVIADVRKTHHMRSFASKLGATYTPGS